MVTPEIMEVLVDSIAHGEWEWNEDLDAGGDSGGDGELVVGFDGWTDGWTERGSGGYSQCRRMRKLCSARFIYYGGKGGHTLHEALHRGLQQGSTRGSTQGLVHTARGSLARSLP